MIFFTFLVGMKKKENNNDLTKKTKDKKSHQIIRKMSSPKRNVSPSNVFSSPRRIPSKASRMYSKRSPLEDFSKNSESPKEDNANLRSLVNFSNYSNYSKIQNEEGVYIIEVGFERYIKQNVLETVNHFHDISTKRFREDDPSFAPGDKLIRFLNNTSLPMQVLTLFRGNKTNVVVKEQVNATNTSVINASWKNTENNTQKHTQKNTEKNTEISTEIRAVQTHNPIHKRVLGLVIGIPKSTFMTLGSFGNNMAHFIMKRMGQVGTRWVFDIVVQAAATVALSNNFTISTFGGLCKNVQIPPSIMFFLNRSVAELVSLNLKGAEAGIHFWGRFQNMLVHALPRFLKAREGADHISRMLTSYSSRLSNVFQNGFFAHSVPIYYSSSIGVSFYKTVCHELVGGVITHEILFEDFKQLLTNISDYLDRGITVIDAYERNKKHGYEVPTGFVTYLIPNRTYKNNNNVSSQLHFLVKDLLKNLPDNVYVNKVEYLEPHTQYTPSRANHTLSQNNTQNTFLNNTTQKGRHLLYHISGTRTSYAYRTRDREFNAIDQAIVRYVNQHYNIYKFVNRKTRARKHLFDFISNRMRPRQLSASIPLFYQMRIKNNTDENLVNYFKRRDTIFTVGKVHRAAYNKVHPSKHAGDMYDVVIKVKKHVEEHLEEILMGIPKEMEILEVIREVEDQDHTGCPYFYIYPYFGGIKQRIFGGKERCQVPRHAMTLTDKRIIQIMNKRMKNIDHLGFINPKT